MSIRDQVTCAENQYRTTAAAKYAEQVRVQAEQAAAAQRKTEQVAQSLVSSIDTAIQQAITDIRKNGKRPQNERVHAKTVGQYSCEGSDVQVHAAGAETALARLRCKYPDITFVQSIRRSDCYAGTVSAHRSGWIKYEIHGVLPKACD